MLQKFGVLVFIFASVLIVSSYEINDADYHGLGSLRFRRDTDGEKDIDESLDDNQSAEDKNGKSKGKNHFFNKCCNYEFPAEQMKVFEKVDEFKKQCSQELHGNKNEEQEKRKRSRGDFVCSVECVSKKMNLADESGNIIEEKFKDHIKNDVAVAEHQKAKADEIAATCIREAKEEGQEQPEASADPSQKKCNPQALKALHCVWRELAKTCPKDLQADSPKCQKFREMLESGNKFDFRHGHGRGHSKDGKGASENQ